MELHSTKNEYSACQSSETTLGEANRKFAKEVLEFQVFFPAILVRLKETFGKLAI